MKTNISNLMNLISDNERKLNLLSNQLFSHVQTTTIKELNGTENIIDDCKEDFEVEYKEYMQLIDDISRMKKIIYQKNNELKLPDGITIQDALVEINMLRKKYAILTGINEYRSLKKRVTEVNNSYFECKTINFDAKNLKSELEMINNEIQNLEFEVSKLNSLEFEI